jgi:hypothetical protein
MDRTVFQPEIAERRGGGELGGELYYHKDTENTALRKRKINIPKSDTAPSRRDIRHRL